MRLTLLTCTAAFMAAPSFAADLGTYRPGEPYHSVIVPTANVCESQCEGDAQCRGWNYVKAAPEAPGVCEFQSTVSDPIASAISISGASNSAMPMSSRVIGGQTNTIRVGTTVTPKAVTSASPSGRTIVRHPLPQQIQSPYSSPRNSSPRQASRKAVAPQPTAMRPALDSYRGPEPQINRPMAARGPARQSPQMRNVRPPAYGQPQYSQPNYPPAHQGRPPIGQPIAPAPHAYAPPQRSPQIQPTPSNYAPAPQQSAPPVPRQQIYAPQGSQQPMPRSSASNPVSWESVRATGTVPQRAPLYGRLNDDVAQSSPTPTTNAYPSQPVTEMPLAGGYSGPNSRRP